jgi:acyl carrier protein
MWKELPVIASQVHAIWSRALNLDEFSTADNFFSLGGNSLVMTRIQRAILSEIGIAVPMDLLFRKSTVAEISEHIEAVLSVA